MPHLRGTKNLSLLLSCCWLLELPRLLFALAFSCFLALPPVAAFECLPALPLFAKKRPLLLLPFEDACPALGSAWWLFVRLCVLVILSHSLASTRYTAYKCNYRAISKTEGISLSGKSGKFVCCERVTQQCGKGETNN